MVKKYAATFAVLGVFALVVMSMPSSAEAGSRSCRRMPHHWGNNQGVSSPVSVNEDNDSVVVVVENKATVNSYTKAYSSTSGKQMFNDDNNTLTTGSATATANSANVVNSNVVMVSVN